MGSLLGESHRPAGNGVPPGDSAGFMLMGISAICIVELTIIPSRFPCYLHAKWSFTETGKHSTKCHSYLALQEMQGSGAYAESSWQGNGKGSYEKSWAVSAFHSGSSLPLLPLIVAFTSRSRLSPKYSIRESGALSTPISIHVWSIRTIRT